MVKRIRPTAVDDTDIYVTRKLDGKMITTISEHWVVRAFSFPILGEYSTYEPPASEQEKLFKRVADAMREPHQAEVFNLPRMIWVEQVHPLSESKPKDGWVIKEERETTPEDLADPKIPKWVETKDGNTRNMTPKEIRVAKSETPVMQKEAKKT